MGKDGNTYAKRQREQRKKQKAEDKRTRRQHRRDHVDVAGEPAVADRPEGEAPSLDL